MNHNFGTRKKCLLKSQTKPKPLFLSYLFFNYSFDLKQYYGNKYLGDFVLFQVYNKIINHTVKYMMTLHMPKLL